MLTHSIIRLILLVPILLTVNKHIEGQIFCKYIITPIVYIRVIYY